MVTDSYYKNQEVTVCVTLAQAKKHLKLRSGESSEDELIQGYIDSAKEDRQNYINRSIDTRDFVIEVSQFETVSFAVNYDNDEVNSIQYYKQGETALTTLDADSYKVRPGIVVGTKTITFKETPQTEKRDDAVVIVVKQGWVSSKVPAPLKQAMLLLIGDQYERREDRGEIGYNRAADALCRPYRKF
ncbi:head-tail connector protein [Flavobacterium anhuiense]|uniref:head-tail connector protein n=1 Tax=Flavobacterium anhuiense TaxID=459526 RepID=UPI000E6B82E4|nr:head-tail connector protein [Flavobacterium anhuiense]